MKKLKKILIFVLISLLLISFVNAVSIGISPGRLRFEEVLREGHAERTLTITTSSEQTLTGHFKVTGDIKDWLSFDPNSTSFSLSRDDPYKLKVKINPPSDVRTGNYSGHIEFITDTVGNVPGRAGGVVKTAVIMIVNSEITGEEFVECRAGAFNIKDTEVDFPLEVSWNMINDGNVRLRPTVKVDIWDQLQENILSSKEIIGDEILPTTQQQMLRRINHDLDVGQYWANVEVEECNAAGFLTFSIVEKGGIVDKGYIGDILHKPWAYTGETIEIIVRFVNQGERSVNSKFKGNIRLDDRIVKIIETEEVIVPSGQNGDFVVYFTPETSGRYVLTGRVVYNNKLTFEKGSVINVNDAPREEKEKGFDILPLLIYVVIIITILFIIRKILKESKRKKHRRKRF